MAKGKKTGGRDFKPGESGNPKGAQAIPTDLKQARQLTRLELERVLNRYIHMTKAEIVKAAQNPDTPAIELMVASLISRATNEGDHKRISFLLDRLVGTVAQTVRVSGDDGGPIRVSVFSEDQLQGIAKAYLEEK